MVSQKDLCHQSSEALHFQIMCSAMRLSDASTGWHPKYVLKPLLRP